MDTFNEFISDFRIEAVYGATPVEVTECEGCGHWILTPDGDGGTYGTMQYHFGTERFICKMCTIMEERTYYENRLDVEQMIMDACEHPNVGVDEDGAGCLVCGAYLPNRTKEDRD